MFLFFLNYTLTKTFFNYCSTTLRKLSTLQNDHKIIRIGNCTDVMGENNGRRIKLLKRKERH